MNSHGVGFTTLAIVRRSDGTIRQVIEDKEPLNFSGTIEIGNRKMPFRSFVRNYLSMDYMRLLRNGFYTNMYYTSGSQPSSTYAGVKNTIDGTNTSNYGLFCGTGTTAVTQDDYELVTKIVEGSGVGQLTYNTVGVGTVTDNGSDKHFLDIQRNITTNSGSGIDITETSLVGTLDTVTDGNIMYARDVFSAVNIANGITKKIKYTLDVPYSTTKGFHANYLKSFQTMLIDKVYCHKLYLFK